jgi:hypothetical protein
MIKLRSTRSWEGWLPLVVATQLAILTYLCLPSPGVALFERPRHEAAPAERDWSGKTLPPVTLGLIDGGPWSPAMVADRPTALVVMNQCGRCSVPYLSDWDDFLRSHAGADVVIATGEQPPKVREVLRREFRRITRLRFACYDGSGALSSWKIGAMPRVFVLGRGGTVQFARPGQYDPQGAMTRLKRQLADRTGKLAPAVGT